MKYQILSLLISIALAGCGVESSEIENQDDQTPAMNGIPTVNRVFVIVDFSNSVNDLACKTISLQTLEIFDTLGEMSEIRIFETIKGTKSKPIFTWKKTTPSRPSQEKYYVSDSIPTIRKGLESLLNSKCSTNSGSCIINALQSVYSHVRGLTPAKRTYLIILSDMLEMSEDIGFATSKANIIDMTNNLPKSNLSASYPLSQFIKPENVAIFNASMNDKAEYIELSGSDECANFWHKVFEQMGFAKSPELNSAIENIVAEIGLN